MLRATYLLLVVGLGAMIVPDCSAIEPISRGVIPSLLGAVWLLAFVGLRYPLQMLPLLMFEFAWKSIWLLAFGLPQWSAGQLPPTFAEDFFNIGLGVILMPLVIPWGYVWRHYVKQPARAGARAFSTLEVRIELPRSKFKKKTFSYSTPSVIQAGRWTSPSLVPPIQAQAPLDARAPASLSRRARALPFRHQSRCR